MTDRLTLKDVEHLLNGPLKTGIKGMPEMRRIFHQLAETMRENERLRAATAAYIDHIIAQEGINFIDEKGYTSGITNEQRELLLDIWNKESEQ
jgi:hypothetical protein